MSVASSDLNELLISLNQQLYYIKQLQKMAQRAKPKETTKAVDATVIDEEILKYSFV